MYIYTYKIHAHILKCAILHSRRFQVVFNSIRNPYMVYSTYCACGVCLYIIPSTCGVITVVRILVVYPRVLCDIRYHSTNVGPVRLQQLRSSAERTKMNIIRLQIAKLNTGNYLILLMVHQYFVGSHFLNEERVLLGVSCE